MNYSSTDHSEDIYPDLCDDYDLIGHIIVNIGGYGVLALRSETSLSGDTQSLLDRELQPDQSFYNIIGHHPRIEFRAWYDTQTERVQNALWEGLKAYDQVMESTISEDHYDTSESGQEITNELVPRILVLGMVLGYDEQAMYMVMNLIEDYHHHDQYESHMDETRLTDYHRLHLWLSGDGKTTLQDVALMGVMCQFK